MNPFEKPSIYKPVITIASNGTGPIIEPGSGTMDKDTLYLTNRIAELESTVKRYREGLQFLLGVLVGVSVECEYCDLEIESATCTCYHFGPGEEREFIKGRIREILENTKKSP